jgi:hypothetical protein
VQEAEAGGGGHALGEGGTRERERERAREREKGGGVSRESARTTLESEVEEYMEHTPNLTQLRSPCRRHRRLPPPCRRRRPLFVTTQTLMCLARRRPGHARPRHRRGRPRLPTKMLGADSRSSTVILLDNVEGVLHIYVRVCKALSEVNTSGRLYHDFMRLLFLHAHREASVLARES